MRRTPLRPPAIDRFPRCSQSTSSSRKKARSLTTARAARRSSVSGPEDPPPNPEGREQQWLEVLVASAALEGAVKKVTTGTPHRRPPLGEPVGPWWSAPRHRHRWSRTSKAAGQHEIYVAESDDAEKYLITPYVDVLREASSGQPPGRRAAAGHRRRQRNRGPVGRLDPDFGVLSDVVDVRRSGTAIHSIFGKRVHRRGQSQRRRTGHHVANGAIEVAAPARSAGEQVTVEVPAPAGERAGSPHGSPRLPVTGRPRPASSWPVAAARTTWTSSSSSRNWPTRWAAPWAPSRAAAVDSWLLPGPVPGGPDRQRRCPLQLAHRPSASPGRFSTRPACRPQTTIVISR